MAYHLLTPKEVAKLLNVSPRTVYEHFRELGGFYPAGIRVLRFDPDTITDILEQSKMRMLPKRDRDQTDHFMTKAQEKDLRRRMAEDRHGLFALSKSLPRGKHKTDPNRHGI